MCLSSGIWHLPLRVRHHACGCRRGQCKEKTTTHLFRLIRAKFSADETNAVINWLKHPSGPNAAEITEQEVVVTLIRAIQKFGGTYEEAHQKFKDFSAWCLCLP
jgi:hypothetical protein